MLGCWMVYRAAISFAKRSAPDTVDFLIILAVNNMHQSDFIHQSLRTESIFLKNISGLEIKVADIANKYRPQAAYLL